MPSAGETLLKAKKALSDALLAHHQNKKLAAAERPTMAHLEAADGSKPVVIRCVPTTTGVRIETVGAPHA